jgi:hypothetical protein
MAEYPCHDSDPPVSETVLSGVALSRAVRYALTWVPLRRENGTIQYGWVWRTQAWAAIWTASPGAAQRRGVGQVQVADRVDRHTVEDRGGGDVDTLGDLGVLVAEELHAEEPAGDAMAMRWLPG